MLLRHSAAYLLARGLPGLINFGALAIYSRQLTPEDYGRYALIIAVVSMAGVIVFQWHRLVLARWLATRQHDEQRFLGEILLIFLLLAVVTAFAGLVLAAVWPDPIWQRHLVLAVALLLVQEWVELNLILAAAQLAPTRYGRMLGAKTALALILGTSLAALGYGAAAPLVGLIVGCALAVPLFGRSPWRGVRPLWPTWQTLQAQLRYGLPLVATFALAWVVASSDRLIIGWLINVGAAGRYAVGYDLAQNSLGVLLAIVQVAAYPLAVRTLEQQGIEAAREQVRRNGELIVTLALAGAAALAALAQPIAALVVGAEFRETTAALIPWVAFAAALGGIKAFHFDMAFHVTSQSGGLLASVAIAGIANILLNFLLIPTQGILGAAQATVIAMTIGTGLSGLLGRRTFPMPPFLPMLARSSCIGAIVLLTSYVVIQGDFSDLSTIFIGVTASTSAAVVMVIFLNQLGFRSFLQNELPRPFARRL